MEDQPLIADLVLIGLAGLLGFLIGLERTMGQTNGTATIRDFVIFGLIGAVSAYAGEQYDNSWLILGAFLGVLSLLISGYWIEQRNQENADPGITTEAAAVVTFFLGVLIVRGAPELAIAVGIGLLVILSEKKVIERFSTQIQSFELRAAIKFLVITFVVLPVLPHESLDNFVTAPVGKVDQVDAPGAMLRFELQGARVLDPGSRINVYAEQTGKIGALEIATVSERLVSARFEGDALALATLAPGTILRSPFVPDPIATMLSALKPFKIWLIVVLVSFIGFIGYVLIKVMGAGAGIGLTGLIGGLASSTVTTLSFSGRSNELPQLNRVFAVAVILASSIMFPRVLLQIGVFNQDLMANIALPMLVTGGAGLAMAAAVYLISKAGASEAHEISFDNPFSLKSAVTFGLLFATILVATRVATAYLGDQWLPLIAIVSGLTDADAIAFSVSDLQRAGLISLDWASFNLVLGSLANTYMKLFLVFSLGHRGLFKHCLIAFLIMGAAGIATMLLYYDL